MPLSERKVDEHSQYVNWFMRGQMLLPGSSVYVNDGGALRVIMASRQPGVEALMTVRMLMPDGRLKWERYKYSPPGDGSWTEYIEPLDECFIVSMNIGPLGVAKPGGFYMMVLAIETTANLSAQGQMLVNGYLIHKQSLTYPNPRFVGLREGPGRITTIVGTDPAPGQEISESVPSGTVWRLISVRFGFLTSATGGNRSVTLVLDDGTNVLVSIDYVAQQAANADWAYNYATGFTRLTTPSLYYPNIHLPMNMVMLPGWRIRTWTSAMQADDNYSAPIMNVEEWVE